MSPWHRHDWQKFDVEFNEPIPPDDRTDQRLSSPYELQAFGFTNITWKCRRCPAVKIEQHAGRVAM